MTITQIRKANELAGHTFFDPSHTRHSWAPARSVCESAGSNRVAFTTRDEGQDEAGRRSYRWHAWAFDHNTGQIRMIEYTDRRDSEFPTSEAAQTVAVA